MRRIICAFITLIAFQLMACPVYATYDIDARVYDGAGLLSESESSSLKSRINNIIDNYKFDAVIVTVDSLDGKSPRDYADDYYDYNGFGFGDSYDGIIFLISIEDRDYYISTAGKGYQIIDDLRINAINNEVVSYLSSEKYYQALTKFLEMTERYLENPESGSEGSGGKFVFVWIAALIIALISVLLMKAQLNTARPKPLAHDYVVPGSFNLTHKRDSFLTTNTTRTLRPKDKGKSEVHTSSSGRKHGGGGGKF